MTLGLPVNANICLYAGNLDRYQGWEHLIEALDLLRHQDPSARLLVATESEPRPLHRVARTKGLADAVDVVPLGSERMRTLVHAASDLAWIPRRTEGGLPIKMLDAFSRGLPVVAMTRATVGLRLANACMVVSNDDPSALATGALRLLRDTDRAVRQRKEAHGYLAREHSMSAYVDAMNDWLQRGALNLPTTTPSAPRQRVEPELRAR